MLTVCFTGHRPDKLGGYNCLNPLNVAIECQLEDTIEELILKGYNTFISGGALGVDQMAARNVITLKNEYPHIALIIARPFPSQACKWTTESQKYFEGLCNQADEIVDVCQDPYAPWKMQKRNEWMVDNSDLVVAVWDGSNGGTGNCVKYAKSKNKEIIRINPNDFK
jgi:uncharacterized phage-like protein YoqJ